jgi:hypothetical protein
LGGGGLGCGGGGWGLGGVGNSGSPLKSNGS